MRAHSSMRSSPESTGWAYRARSIGAALSIGVLIWQLALGGEQSPLVREQVTTIEARVESVDVASGKLVLRRLSGERTVYSLGKDVKNLDRVRIGDRIVLYSHMGVAAEIKPAGEPMTQRSETTSSNGQSHLLPQGTVRRTVTMTVELESLDPNSRTITFKRPDGTSRTVKLRDDQALEFAKGLKTGDRLSITYTESTAFKITSR
jgi:hypothetical protein